MRRKRLLPKLLLIALVIIVIAAVCAVLLVRRFYPLRYLDIISKYAEEYNLSVELVCAVIHSESRFDENAVSPEGASGLMQIMESTAYWLAPQIGMDDFDYGQIFDPEINIRLGCYYLSMLGRRYGDIDVALSAYNAGSGNVEEWLKNPEYSSDEATLDHIPFTETRNYVSRVASSQRIYSILLRFPKLFITVRGKEAFV